MLPVTTHRFISARLIATPSIDWLAPIDHSAIDGPRANAAAARAMSSAATPHASAALAAVHSPASSCPAISAFSSARSVPGAICRWTSAAAAASVRRGSTTISTAPRSCASRIRPHRIG